MPAENNPIPPARNGLSPNPPVLQQVQDERIRPPVLQQVQDERIGQAVLQQVQDERPRPPVLQQVQDERIRPPILQQVQDERIGQAKFPAVRQFLRFPLIRQLPIFPLILNLLKDGRKKRPLLPWLLPALALIGIWQFLTAVPAVHAHGGVAPGDNLWAAWNTTNPLPTLGLFLAALLYVNGLGKWDKPSHPINAWQKGSFFAGILVLFLALQSPLDPLAEHYFFVHQVQHLLLRMVGPLLVLLGAPLTPMLRGLPLWLRQGAVRPLVRQPWVRQGYQRLTNPVAAVALFLVALYFWQVPGLVYNADETGVSIVHKMGKVLAHLGRRHVFCCIRREGKNPHNSHLRLRFRSGVATNDGLSPKKESP